MGRAPCCDKANVKKGPWSPEEDAKLKEFIEKYGTGGNWIALPQKAGLKRCGKSCRLRWLNYLRPNIKHGEFSDDEDRIICGLFNSIGSRWSIIAAQLPGRTDNDIKNYWNTKLKKKLMGIVNSASSQMKLINPPLSFPSLSQTISSTTPLTYKSANTTSDPPFYNPQTTIPSTHLNNSSITSTSITESLMGPMDHYQVKDTIPIFGGEPSCSSSDGSCNNQISYGKDIEVVHEDRNDSNGQYLRLQQSYSCNGGYDENQKTMLDFGLGCHGTNWSQRPIHGLWGSAETPLEYDIEEIKQLVSTNGCNNYIDEAKTIGSSRIMYF